MKTALLFRLSLLLTLGLGGSPLASAATAKLPLYDGLSAYPRQVTTGSPEAQRYFNQGLAFTYGFDREMAIKSFQEAARLDPLCAMAWWGIANACAPNINSPMVDPDHHALAWDAITQAQAAAAHGTPVEQAFIRAQAKRYGEKYHSDRRALDEADAAAMREAWRAHPEDADVGVLFAEAMMDLRPRDQWSPDGKLQPGTEEVLAASGESDLVAASPDKVGPPGCIQHTCECDECGLTLRVARKLEAGHNAPRLIQRIRPAGNDPIFLADWFYPRLGVSLSRRAIQP